MYTYQSHKYNFSWGLFILQNMIKTIKRLSPLVIGYSLEFLWVWRSTAWLLLPFQARKRAYNASLLNDAPNVPTCPSRSMCIVVALMFRLFFTFVCRFYDFIKQSDLAEYNGANNNHKMKHQCNNKARKARRARHLANSYNALRPPAARFARDVT